MANGENLGAKFTIDITDLKAGLAQANRLIRESESEFLEAAAGMDSWEDSAAGLEKRIETLTTQIGLQQDKVSALVKEKKRIIEQMEAEGKSNEEIEKAVDGVNKSIQREGKQLDALKKKLKQSEKKMEDFEDAADDSADALEDMSDETEDTKDATDKLTDEIEDQKDKLKRLKREYSNVVLEQGDASDEAKDLKKKVKDLSKELKTNEKRLEDVADGLDDLGDGAKDAGGGFTIAKGAAAGLVAGGLSAIGSAALDAFNSLMDLAESTRETRTNMAKLETAFETAGLSAEAASETYKTMYGILGDEGQATEAVSHLAQLVDTEEELVEWTTIATGVYATFGDSLPIENLTEAANETAKTGQITGGLADALNWAGVSEEDFQKKLDACSTEQERQALITETLTGLYGDAATAYAENNAAVIAAQEATADYNEAMANLGGEMEPLNTAFTNLKTTLVEAVTPAVGALSEGLAGLITNLITAEEETDLLTESQRAIVTAAEESAEAYTANKEAADEMADANLANVQYGEKLLTQLESLVDENGNVKAGEEARAEFIMGELNAALGSEYSQLSDIVDANGQIKDSVYEVIEAKKAQILMEAYEETYREAVLKVAEAERARAIQAQEIAAQEEVANAAYMAAQEARSKLNEKTANVKTEADGRSLLSEQRYVQGLETEALKQAGILEDKQTAYGETEDRLYGFYADIANYEAASVAMMEGNTEEAIGYLEKLSDGYIGTASSAEEAAAQQYEILRQQVIDTQNHAEWIADAYDRGVEGVTEEMVATAKEQAETAKAEFERVGGNLTEGIADGAEAKQSSLSGSLKKVVSGALAAAKKAAGIESPSKLFRDEVGNYIGEGVAVGIDDSTRDVVGSINDQIDSARKAYNVGEISDVISGKVNASRGDKNGSGGLASGSGGNVIVNQTNNYSQAHSRYEIYKSKQDTAAAVRLALGGA